MGVVEVGQEEAGRRGRREEGMRGERAGRTDIDVLALHYAGVSHEQLSGCGLAVVTRQRLGFYF